MHHGILNLCVRTYHPSSRKGGTLAPFFTSIGCPVLSDRVPGDLGWRAVAPIFLGWLTASLFYFFFAKVLL